MLILFVFVSILPLIICICRSSKKCYSTVHEIPSSPSTSVTSSPETKYDVFLSFRGEDTRDNFTSHLYAALCSHNISTFIDDKLERGEGISQSLLDTIQGSKLSVIIFSENYTSSKWCLEELVKILECQKRYGQAVIPIFYKVDPSDVRKQKGSYEDAFAKYKNPSEEKVQSWRAALEEAANLSGLDSHNFKSESEFVKAVVRFVFNKLHEMAPPSKPKGLVGINARINDIESLLKMGSRDVRIVGIWGMPGIGKTTLAKAIFDRFYTQFEGSCFLEHVGDKLDNHGAVDVQKQLLSEILDRDHLLKHPLSSGNSFINDLLCRRNVLIVLDDVWSFRKLQELLLLQHDSFGPGTKIIVTSRDKQVLNNAQVDETYEVKRLDCREALQLFCQKAFKNGNCPIDYTELLKRAEIYAQGNPLALTVLGATLYGRSKAEWHCALNKLALDPDIHNVLRISYDKLDPEEQEIFLNFAHYFRGAERNYATVMLEALHGRSVLFDINEIIDKCLITVSHNEKLRRDFLQMHDLVHRMAYSIGSAESKIPGKRKRLCDPEDIFSVLTRKKGTEHVEGISLDMSKLSTEMHLSSDAFASMDGLRFLKFHFSGFCENNSDKVFLPPCGLDYISDMLICFHWIGFPSKSLPPNFFAENLVDLDLSDSKVVKLWGGVQNVVNLRKVNLNYCSHLTELPDLSMACNLEDIDLTRCTSLIEVPSFVQYLDKLKRLDLRWSRNIESFPERIASEVLTGFLMEGCPKITNFPEIISPKLTTLFLGETTIELPVIFNKLLHHDIRYLELSGTAMKEIPSSIFQLLRSLQYLVMLNSTQLSSLPSSIYKLKYLHLHGSLKLEKLPDIMEPMESLTTLILINTAIKELPSSIKNLTALETLGLPETPVKELPELPSSLLSLDVDDCESLETISSFKVRNLRKMNLANCFKLDQKALIEELQLKFQSGEISHNGVEVLLSGSQIPSWFSYQSVGSSVTVQLPSENHHQLKGLAFCLVFSFSHLDFPYYISHRRVREMRSLIDFNGHAKSKNGDVIYKSSLEPSFSPLKIHDSDYMLLKYVDIKENWVSEVSGNEVSFEFFPIEMPSSRHMSDDEKILLREIFKQCEVKKCGAFFVFDENPPISDEDLSEARLSSSFQQL